MHIRQASNLLRGGLAFIWFWEGLVPKFLFIASRDVSLVAKIGLGEFAASAIHLAGAVEILMGAALALGIGIRIVCAIQVLLLACFLVALGVTEPRLLVDPFAALSKIVPLAAAATALFVLEGTAGRRIARGLAFSRVTEAGAVWVYRTQARHLTGQKANLLATIAGEEGTHAEQLEPLWHAAGGRPAPTRVYAIGGWILGHLTGIAGWRTVRARNFRLPGARSASSPRAVRAGPSGSRSGTSSFGAAPSLSRCASRGQRVQGREMGDEAAKLSTTGP